MKKRSTEDFDGLPYVCTFLQASLWFYYAITKTGAIVVAFICAVGSVLKLIYVTLFLIYAPSRKKAKTAMWVGLLDVGFLGAILLITHFAMHGDLRLSIIGSTCAVISIIMYGSPLANMRTVLTTESVEYMPFLLSFVLFLNGAVWTCYAVLAQDLFIGVPNGIGLALGLTQLILYAIYMKPRGGKGGIEEMEEGKQPLIHSQPTK